MHLQQPVAELTPEQIAANEEQAKADAAAQERAKVFSEYHSHPGVQLRALAKDISSQVGTTSTTASARCSAA